MAEYWDVCNINGIKLGYTKRSDEEFDKGEYHVGASLWLANLNGDLLIQKRAASKRTGPNLWSITGGKVQAGESSVEACLREVHEEIGLTLHEQDICFLYRSIGSDILYDDYIAIIDFSINKAVLNLSEVSEIKWTNWDEILHLCLTNQFMYNNTSDLLKVRNYLGIHLADFHRNI